MSYSYTEHKNRFATWCAATAASASKNCRFKVSDGAKLLENVSLIEEVDRKIWEDSGDFDDWHNKVCKKLIDESRNLVITGFTYGVSAKLLNCYIKAFYIGDANVLSVAHPPIDRLLLASLELSNYGSQRLFWRQYKNIGWSNFRQEEYLSVINMIRSINGGATAFWQIEQHWQGFQN